MHLFSLLLSAICLYAIAIEQVQCGIVSVSTDQPCIREPGNGTTPTAKMSCNKATIVDYAQETDGVKSAVPAELTFLSVPSSADGSAATNAYRKNSGDTSEVDCSKSSNKQLCQTLKQGGEILKVEFTVSKMTARWSLEDIGLTVPSAYYYNTTTTPMKEDGPLPDECAPSWNQMEGSTAPDDVILNLTSNGLTNAFFKTHFGFDTDLAFNQYVMSSMAFTAFPKLLHDSTRSDWRIQSSGTQPFGVQPHMLWPDDIYRRWLIGMLGSGGRIVPDVDVPGDKICPGVDVETSRCRCTSNILLDSEIAKGAPATQAACVGTPVIGPYGVTNDNRRVMLSCNTGTCAGAEEARCPFASGFTHGSSRCLGSRSTALMQKYGFDNIYDLCNTNCADMYGSSDHIIPSGDPDPVNNLDIWPQSCWGYSVSHPQPSGQIKEPVCNYELPKELTLEDTIDNRNCYCLMRRAFSFKGDALRECGGSREFYYPQMSTAFWVEDKFAPNGVYGTQLEVTMKNRFHHFKMCSVNDGPWIPYRTYHPGKLTYNDWNNNGHDSGRKGAEYIKFPICQKLWNDYSTSACDYLDGGDATYPYCSNAVQPQDEWRDLIMSQRVCCSDTRCNCLRNLFKKTQMNSCKVGGQSSSQLNDHMDDCADSCSNTNNAVRDCDGYPAYDCGNRDRGPSGNTHDISGQVACRHTLLGESPCACACQSVWNEVVVPVNPLCTVYRLQDNAEAMYNVTATVRDKDGNIIANLTVGTSMLVNGTLSPRSLDTSDDGLVSLMLESLEFPRGDVAPRLGGYVVVCGDRKQDFNGGKSHWPDEVSQRTGPFKGSPSPLGTDNPFERAARTTAKNQRWQNRAPLPSTFQELFDVGVLSNISRSFVGRSDSYEGQPTWWYYVPPKRMKHYGQGCNQIGWNNFGVADPQSAATMCGGRTGTCVPGYDFSGSANLSEAFVKPRVQVPAFVARTFVEYELNSYKAKGAEKDNVALPEHLPPGYLGVDGLPAYWLDGNYLYGSNDQSSQSVYSGGSTLVRFKFTVAGKLLRDMSTLSSGLLAYTDGNKAPDDAPDSAKYMPYASCQIGAANSAGGLNVRVINTGKSTAAYSLRVNCTSTISQDGQVNNIGVPPGDTGVLVGMRLSVASLSQFERDIQAPYNDAPKCVVSLLAADIESAVQSTLPFTCIEVNTVNYGAGSLVMGKPPAIHGGTKGGSVTTQGTKGNHNSFHWDVLWNWLPDPWGWIMSFFTFLIEIAIVAIGIFFILYIAQVLRGRAVLAQTQAQSEAAGAAIAERKAREEAQALQAYENVS